PIRPTPAPPRGYAPRPARCPSDRPPFPTVRAKPWRTAPPECPRPPARRRKIAATDPGSSGRPPRFSPDVPHEGAVADPTGSGTRFRTGDAVLRAPTRGSPPRNRGAGDKDQIGRAHV